MSDNDEIRKETKDGKVYVVQKDSSGAYTFPFLAGGMLAYIAVLALLYGLLSFNRPDLIEKVLEKKVALLSILISAGFILIVFSIKLASLGSATFEKVSNLSGGRHYTTSLISFVQETILKLIGIEFSPLDRSDDQANKGTSKEDPRGGGKDLFSYGAFSSDTPFEAYISNILKSLSAYATSSEVTATKLLDKGVAFMAGGLVFYVLAIVIWQIFANLTHPDPNVMYVGMAACSMTFIVVEFLAAWFFKQYRYYVEVSLSCLRVRSVYDRYLLGYYALREFKSEADKNIRNQMTEILKEDVNWPSYKGGVANDFNYMVESMGAAHTSMEKMKGIFHPEKTTKPKNPTKPKAEDV